MCQVQRPGDQQVGRNQTGVHVHGQDHHRRDELAQHIFTPGQGIGQHAGQQQVQEGDDHRLGCRHPCRVKDLILGKDVVVALHAEFPGQYANSAAQRIRAVVERRCQCVQHRINRNQHQDNQDNCIECRESDIPFIAEEMNQYECQDPQQGQRRILHDPVSFRTGYHLRNADRPVRFLGIFIAEFLAGFLDSLQRVFLFRTVSHHNHRSLADQPVLFNVHPDGQVNHPSHKHCGNDQDHQAENPQGGNGQFLRFRGFDRKGIRPGDQDQQQDRTDPQQTVMSPGVFRRADFAFRSPDQADAGGPELFELDKLHVSERFGCFFIFFISSPVQPVQVFHGFQRNQAGSFHSCNALIHFIIAGHGNPDTVVFEFLNRNKASFADHTFVCGDFAFRRHRNPVIFGGNNLLCQDQAFSVPVIYRVLCKRNGFGIQCLNAFRLYGVLQHQSLFIDHHIAGCLVAGDRHDDKDHHKQNHSRNCTEPQLARRHPVAFFDGFRDIPDSFFSSGKLNLLGCFA